MFDKNPSLPCADLEEVLSAENETPATSSAAPISPAAGSAISKKDSAVRPKHPLADELLVLLAASGITVIDPGRVHNGEKAKHGLNPSEVKCIDRIGVSAVTTMRSPVGFKFVIYPHGASTPQEIVKYVKYLPRVLSRFGRSKRLPDACSGKVLYALKIEESSRGNIHLHLHCVADGYGIHEINCLKERLAEVAGYEVRFCKREPVYDGNMFLTVCKNTGEVLKLKESFRRHAVHYLRYEFEDWRERATYIAKNLTRKALGKFRAFHSSRVKL